MASAHIDPGLHLRPMVLVGDLPASIAFYEQLGAEIVHGGRDSEWVLLQLGTVQIGLLARPADAARGEGTVELHFGAAMPLEQLERRLHRAGYPVAEVTTDRDFGEQLRVQAPDGLLIKISQREPD
jgi:catechol 2,3-dioxygenase-like lactoylglutathione lyase family enzyme